MANAQRTSRSSRTLRISHNTFGIDGRTRIFLAEGEDGPTRRAAEFLAGDIERITGTRPVVGQGNPQPGQAAVFIASADNPNAREILDRLNVDRSAIEGQWEAYLFRIAGDQLVICGADRLATMRGVYGFCRMALGVDPLHRWTQRPPEKRKWIELANIDRVVPSPTFKFRGWFLNAGHLINWNMNHGPVVDIQAKYGHRDSDRGISGSFGREMAEMIYEAALRCDMNFVIPLSYLDLDDPDEKLVADVADEFGLFLSHHHQEPLGANLRVWKDFWTKRGESVPDMSFYKNPQAFETWWGHYAQAWSQYERVVWVIGHRGPGDRPFWLKDEFCPDTMEAHGKAVTDAMEMQIRLIKRACGDKPIHYCATLWQDGSPMHAAGVLRFPPGTMVVMADAGSKQLMREDFYKVQRRPELEYGVYYHVCYGPGGPIWAQGNSPDRMDYALREVVDKGDTALALLNVGNIRPYFPGLSCWSAITTQARGFNAERFLRDWCIEHFGEKYGDEALECYNTFFASFAHPYYPLYDGHRGFWDGVLTNETWRMCQLMYSGDAEGMYSRINRPFPDAWTFLQFHKNKTAAVCGAWDELCVRAEKVSKKLKGSARDLFDDNLAVQSQILRGLYYCAHATAQAALAMLDNRKSDAIKHLGQANQALRKAWTYAAKNGNRGVYRGWFTQQTIADMHLVRMVIKLRDKLAGKKLSTEDRKWLHSTLDLPIPQRSH